MPAGAASPLGRHALLLTGKPVEKVPWDDWIGLLSIVRQVWYFGTVDITRLAPSRFVARGAAARQRKAGRGLDEAPVARVLEVSPLAHSPCAFDDKAYTSETVVAI